MASDVCCCHSITLLIVVVPIANCSDCTGALEVTTVVGSGTDAISTDAAADVTTSLDATHSS